MGEVLEGPWIRDWRCPTCARPAPLFLPNGALNRTRLGPADYALTDPWVLAEAEQNIEVTDVEVCRSCGESIPALVGSLVVPHGRQGMVLGNAGKAETQIIGGILPTASPNRSGLMLFFGDAGTGPYLAERQALAAFTTGRLTSPESQGDITSWVWNLYRARLDWLTRHRNHHGGS
ncbi:hypothetical protein [Thiohalorhabdus methylotrophus]|uniref:Uncharacterized protein n=1 Tax=Thiohalorhabdus methylotrophus TaxID=3242694 RepID=A0ABV4TVV0_9GAMM